MLINRQKDRQNLFEGILLLSDIDGTLLNSKKDIPQRNINAICRFIQGGGHFSLATGRCAQSAKKYAEASGSNFPSVVLNGAAVFDFANNTIVVQQLLPIGYKKIIQQLHTEFPELGIQVYVGSDIYVLASNSIIENQMAIEHLDYVTTAFDDLPDKSNKILLGGTNAQLCSMYSFLENMPLDGMEGMFSETCYYEILPPKTNKGTGAQAIAEHYGIKEENIVAVGDYYNDIDMLKSVAHPIAAGNAPDEVKKLARFVTNDCEYGVVADTIDYIENVLIQKGHL